MKSLYQTLLVACLALLTLSGCSSLIPYEEDFACKRPNNMGKCIDTEQAYEEVRSGNSVTPYAVPASMQDDDDAQGRPTMNLQIFDANQGYSQYLDANYRETANLLNSGITPVLSNGDTIKIVLVPNRVTDKMLLSERIMYVIIEEPEFIMGDYLIEKKAPIPTLFKE
jgi:conjugal transfer pilus assembly protein TraV